MVNYERKPAWEGAITDEAGDRLVIRAYAEEPSWHDGQPLIIIEADASSGYNAGVVLEQGDWDKVPQLWAEARRHALQEPQQGTVDGS